MGVKLILSLMFIFFVFLSLFFFMSPFQNLHFTSIPSNSNFSIISNSLQENYTNMQFYTNMRFSSSRISYSISGDCSLQKQESMESAFRIIENLTPIDFYSVESGPQIIVDCQDSTFENEDFIIDGMFVAGEGGPTNITVAGDFNVILNGKILLIRDSQCPRPNIAIHELMHVFGFDHSSNPDNIMYEVTACDQNIGDDQLNLINQLYSIPSRPDLSIQNVSAVVKGRFLSTNISIINLGLNDAESSRLIIYANEEMVEEIIIEPIDIGYGRLLSLTNLWVPRLKVDELELNLEYSLEELNKENNKIKLEIKKD